MKPTTGGVLLGSSLGGYFSWYLSKSGIIENVEAAKQSFKPLRIPSSRVVLAVWVLCYDFRYLALKIHDQIPIHLLKYTLKYSSI